MIKYFVLQDAEGNWAVYRAIDEQAPLHLCSAHSESDAHLIASALSERVGDRRVGDRRKADRRHMPPEP